MYDNYDIPKYIKDVYNYWTIKIDELKNKIQIREYIKNNIQNIDNFYRIMNDKLIESINEFMDPNNVSDENSEYIDY